jgi:hypothetical protein
MIFRRSLFKNTWLMHLTANTPPLVKAISR